MHRQAFTTNFTALLIRGSAAIGVVDIWRSPRVKSSYDGSAFHLAIPALNTERVSARRTHDRTVSASVLVFIGLIFV
jgi:SNF family Na+-dependent transporter